MSRVPLPGAPREPEVEIATGPAVPALVLRAAVALLGAAVLVLAALAPGGPVAPGAVPVLALLGAAPALRPRAGVAALVVVGAGVALLAADPLGGRHLAALVLAVHLLLWLAAVAARTTRRTRVEVAVLRADLPLVAGLQAAAQALALAVGVLAGATAGGDAWRLLGLAAAVGVTAVALRRPAQPWWRSLPEGER